MKQDLKGRFTRPFFLAALPKCQTLCPGNITIHLMSMPSATPIGAIAYAAVNVDLRRLASRFPVHEAILFGNHTRVTQTKLSIADIVFDAMLGTCIKVQPLPFWDSDPRKPEQWLNPELRCSIELTGISVWQASP